MITELDIIRSDADLLAADHPELLDSEREDWEYWLEVKDCCGGAVWSCSHYGYYPDLDDRFTYRED